MTNAHVSVVPNNHPHVIAMPESVVTEGRNLSWIRRRFLDKLEMTGRPKLVIWHLDFGFHLLFVIWILSFLPFLLNLI